MNMKKKLVAAALTLTLAVNSFCGISVNAEQKENSPSDKAIVTELANQLAEVENYVAASADLDDIWDDDLNLDDYWDDDKTSVEDSTGDLQIINMDGQLVSSLVPGNLKNMSDINKKKYATYLAYAPAGYGKDVVIPVKVKSRGALAYALAATYDEDVYYRLYSDKACTDMVYESDHVAFLEKAGTYYIKVGQYELAKEGESGFSLALGFVSGANGVLKNNSNLLGATFGTKSSVYYKFTVKQTTKVTIKIESDYTKYVTLCNSKKSAITNEEYISSADSKAVFGVAKGTYYIRVKATEGLVSITPKFTAMKSVAGPSKAKAGTIKVNGKTQNIVVLPGDSKKKYYYLKFYNPKNQKITVNVTSDFTSGKMEFDFYDTKNDSFGTRTIWSGLNEKNTFNPYVYSYTSNNGYKLPKGTYYIRFKKLDKKTAGTIQVNIKTKK